MPPPRLPCGSTAHNFRQAVSLLISEKSDVAAAGQEGLVSVLTGFGVVAVTAMMVFYWLEPRGIRYTFVFGVACLAASAYGWMAGTWPFGVVEMVWAAVAFARWNSRRHSRHGIR